MVKSSYLLVVNIPLGLSADGKLFFFDRLWLKDLVAHCVYIKRLSLACPVIKTNVVPVDAVFISENPSLYDLDVVPLPSMTWLHVFISLPVSLARLWRVVSKADIVHFGVAGWPIPYGWLAFVISKFKKKKTLLIIESNFWLNSKSTFGKMKGLIFDLINKVISRQVDLLFVTSRHYQELYGGLLLPASWIDVENVRVEKKSFDRLSIKYLFVGRLTSEKGVGTLLDAIQLLRNLRHNKNIEISICGEGELLDVVWQEVLCNDCTDFVVKYIPPVPYEKLFVDVLDKADVLIVPTLSDEQPRIIWDALARGLPIIASNALGNVDIVDVAVGFLYDKSDHKALADLLLNISPDDFPIKSMNAIEKARSYTHAAMHQVRESEILKLVD